MLEISIADVEALQARARELCAEPKVLQSIARTICADSLITKAHARGVRGVGRLRGASDADIPEITSVLHGAPLCTTCIGRKIGVSRKDVDSGIEDIRRTLYVIANVARCDMCLRTTLVHRLG